MNFFWTSQSDKLATLAASRWAVFFSRWACVEVCSKSIQGNFYAKRARSVFLTKFEKHLGTFLMMILWEGWVVFNFKEPNFRKVIIGAIKKVPDPPQLSAPFTFYLLLYFTLYATSGMNIHRIQLLLLSTPWKAHELNMFIKVFIGDHWPLV